MKNDLISSLAAYYGTIEEAFREGHRAARIRYAPAEPNGPTRFENVDWEYAPIRQAALAITPTLATVAAANNEGVAEQIEAAAKIVTDGYRCRTCKAVFVNNGDVLLGGHPENDCSYPNWDKLGEDDQAAAIRFLSQPSGRTWQPPIWEKDNG